MSWRKYENIVVIRPMRELGLVVFFGLLGICSRYGIDLLFSNSSHSFPVNTFLINILGCFLAGTVYSFGQYGALSVQLQIGLVVGFCGGFTTFSAYALQAFKLLDSGKVGVAMAYFVLSPLIGLISAYMGVILTKKLLV